jgi:hypothetical protein
MNNETIRSFDVINKKEVNFSFDCECGKKIKGTAKIPKPNPKGENFTTGMGSGDVEITCCNRTYQINVQVDQHGTSGTIYITPAIKNEASLKIN